MASPPPADIRHITDERGQVARVLWEIEHTAGPGQEADFTSWAQQRYGLDSIAARHLWTYGQRAVQVGQRLQGAAGPVPRGSQMRNPGISNAYRVRVYAHLREEPSGVVRTIPLEWDLPRNPSMADVRNLTAAWNAHRPKQTTHRTYHGYPTSTVLVDVTVRSLECYSC